MTSNASPAVAWKPSYSEMKFWSPSLGCKASRIYVFDRHGQEHYAIVPMDDKGKVNRKLKNAVVDIIVRHVEDGEDPGEVAVDVEAIKRRIE